MNPIYTHLARKAGKKSVSAGDVLTLPVDLAIAHDGSGPQVVKWFEDLELEDVFDPDKVVFILDHSLPAPNAAAREGHLAMTAFAQKYGIHLYDRGQGVTHQIILEHFRLPRGSILVGADGHVCTAGAYGVLAFTLKPQELAAVLSAGTFELRLPEVMAIEIAGKITWPLLAKDVILHLLGKFGVSGLKGKAVILHGEAILGATLDERLTIANMVSEMGGITAYVPENEELTGVSENHRFDTEQIPLSVACPPDPGNVRPLSELVGTPVTQVVVGACSSGRLSDMQIVAGLLHGKRVHPDVTMVVVPASLAVLTQMESLGYTRQIREAGAIIVNPGCGPCSGNHLGVLSKDDVVVSTTTKNIPGRMGDKSGAIYLASPLVATLAALHGEFCQGQFAHGSSAAPD